MGSWLHPLTSSRWRAWASSRPTAMAGKVQREALVRAVAARTGRAQSPGRKLRQPSGQQLPHPQAGVSQLAVAAGGHAGCGADVVPCPEIDHRSRGGDAAPPLVVDRAPVRPQAVTQLREGPQDTAAVLAASHGLEDM